MTYDDEFNIIVDYSTTDTDGVRLWAQEEDSTDSYAVFSNPSDLYYGSESNVPCCFLGVVADRAAQYPEFHITKITVQMYDDKRDQGGEETLLAEDVLDVDYTFLPAAAGASSVDGVGVLPTGARPPGLMPGTGTGIIIGGS